jgi:ABC-type multidrug transport system ATPase subunit
MTNSESAIWAEGLRKRFGRTEALRGVGLEVPRGSVFGLLGPNGAGKTTAVRILSTLTLPDAGRARVAGHDVVRDADKVRYRIGLAGQRPRSPPGVRTSCSPASASPTPATAWSGPTPVACAAGST